MGIVAYFDKHSVRIKVCKIAYIWLYMDRTMEPVEEGRSNMTASFDPILVSIVKLWNGPTGESGLGRLIFRHIHTHMQSLAAHDLPD